MNTLLIIVIVYLVFVSSFTITYTTKKYIRKFKYNGLLWVFLDVYTINIYDSTDNPIEWVNITKKYK